VSANANNDDFTWVRFAAGAHPKATAILHPGTRHPVTCRCRACLDYHFQHARNVTPTRCQCGHTREQHPTAPELPRCLGAQCQCEGFVAAG